MKHGLPIVAAFVVLGLFAGGRMPAAASGRISVVRVTNGITPAAIIDVTVSYFPRGEERASNIRFHQSAEFPPMKPINVEVRSVTVSIHGDVKGRPIRGGCGPEQIYAGKPGLYIVRFASGSIPGVVKCKLQ